MRSCLEYKFFANYAFLKSSEDEIPKIPEGYSINNQTNGDDMQPDITPYDEKNDEESSHEDFNNN